MHIFTPDNRYLLLAYHDQKTRPCDRKISTAYKNYSLRCDETSIYEGVYNLFLTNQKTNSTLRFTITDYKKRELYKEFIDLNKPRVIKNNKMFLLTKIRVNKDADNNLTATIE